MCMYFAICHSVFVLFDRPPDFSGPPLAGNPGYATGVNVPLAVIHCPLDSVH